MAAARKPASRRKAADSSARSRPRARAQRSSLGALGLPVIEQRHLDLLGLALVALGVFLAFPLYLGWDGGAAGQAATQGLAYAVGQVAYGVPVAIVIAGALFVLRPVLPAIRPFRAGAICLFAALTLMLAAGTFGIGPAGARDGYWSAPFFEPRGGIVGDALLWASASAFSTIGSHILALFLLVAGVLLVTGASVAGVLRATGSGLADTTRLISRAVPVPARRPPRETIAQEPATAQLTDPEPYGPPEPEDSEVIIRATHVEAPPPPRPEEIPVARRGFWSGETRFPDIYGAPLPEPGGGDDERAADEPSRRDRHGQSPSSWPSRISRTPSPGPATTSTSSRTSPRSSRAGRSRPAT